LEIYISQGARKRTMWYTEHAMNRYGIVLGAFAGLVVFLSNISESGVLRALGFGVITALGLAIFGRTGARLFGEREKGN
jgi:hypothetical protein